MDAYRKLVERFQEVQLLRPTSAILEWDERTYLPKKGVRYRANQLGYLAAKAHLLSTEPVIGEWLAACEQTYPLWHATKDVTLLILERDPSVRC
jgi:carboxypeptidase Taq